MKSLHANRDIFRRLGFREWRLLFETVCVLGLVRMAVRLLPFRWISPCLGTIVRPSDPLEHRPGRSHVDGKKEFPPNQERAIDRIRLAIWFAGRITPWRSMCLEQAIAGKLMLRLRRIPTNLYLGVEKRGADMKAHAWLRAEDRFVTGQAEHERFTVVANYSEDAP